MSKEKIENRISELIESLELEIEGSKSSTLTRKLVNIVDEATSETSLTNMLKILYENEEHHLRLIKEYKEEIKFANSVQEDVRRERVQFFTQILREVTESLNNAQLDSNVTSKWIHELVESYTKSLDLSSELAKTHVVDILGLINEETKKQVKKVDNKKTPGK